MHHIREKYTAGCTQQVTKYSASDFETDITEQITSLMKFIYDRSCSQYFSILQSTFQNSYTAHTTTAV
jgi:hypothetical protein